MSKHTWEAKFGRSYNGAEDQQVMDVVEGEQVIFRGHWGNHAKAKLAAAAPDLAEALERVTELLNDPGVGDHEQWKRDCREWTAKARAALKKAGG